MFDDEDLPKTKSPETFPRKLEGVSVEHMRQYKRDLEAEIKRVDAEIESRSSVLSAAENLFK